VSVGRHDAEEAVLELICSAERPQAELDDDGRRSRGDVGKG